MALPYIEMLFACAMVGSLTCFLRPVHVCGLTFSIELALWWYPSIRHNELRDITATLLTEVCHSVGTKPGLQPLSGEVQDSK